VKTVLAGGKKEYIRTVRENENRITVKNVHKCKEKQVLKTINTELAKMKSKLLNRKDELKRQIKNL